MAIEGEPMKTIFAHGIEQQWVPILREKFREKFNVVVNVDKPSAEIVNDQVLLLTSESYPPENLHLLKTEYPDATILYHYRNPGLRGFLQVHAAAEALGIHFLSPRASVDTLLDLLSALFHDGIDQSSRIVGFFGSGVGVGVTSAAATFAAAIAAKEKNVIMLGLDFFHPGWYKRPSISLDSWQPRLTGKVLQVSDFDELIEHRGFRYLPGNCDILSIQQYREDEISFLIERACEAADIVILDCGSIPESAGWYVGVQKATIRFFVTHPAHHYTIQPIMDILRHLQVSPQDFQLIVNRSNAEGGYLSSRDIATEYKMLFSDIEIPVVSKELDEIVLPLGKKEQQAVGLAVDGILKAFGFENPVAKKGGLFR